VRELGAFLDRVIAGDCIDVLRDMPSGAVDLVVTDPPYLVRYRSRDGRGYPNDDNDRWLLPAFREIYRVLRCDRLCVSFYGWNRVDRFMAAWRAAGFTPVDHVVWVKAYASSAGFTRRFHEAAYILAKGTPPRPRMPPPSVLEWRYTGDTLHPTQKPLVAMLPLVRAYSNVGDVVLDPFAGSGTTCLAAAQLRRHYVGIELRRDYAATAQARLDARRHA
jgi:site-specific DNA-methyltransferase (adenine-specific)